jgi:hypothetical protein
VRKLYVILCLFVSIRVRGASTFYVDNVLFVMVSVGDAVDECMRA